MSAQYSIGSVCTGYGGLDMAVGRAFGPAHLAWVADIDAGPAKLLAHHFPEVPNLGDITTVNWGEVEPVDVIVGGTPCQDLSLAGRRAGMTPGTRSGLWESMAEAIRVLKPRLVVWENVRGALSAGAFCQMEPAEGCLGVGSGRPLLRALGRVLGDLANHGYDAGWASVRASEVGAPHQRERVFVLAMRRGASWRGIIGDPNSEFGDEPGLAASGQASGGRTQSEFAGSDRAPGAAGRPVGDVELLPTACANPSGNSPQEHLRKKPGRSRVTDLAILVENGLLESGGRLLPTPRTANNDNRQSAGYGPNLGGALDLLPTPKRQDADWGLPRTSGRPPEKSTHLATRLAYTDFGVYAPAIARWEAVMGPAPAPTVKSRTKNVLSPHFVEWMMGVPAGWVTGPEVGLSRSQQIRMLGNGLVPQQGAFALTQLAHMALRSAAA